MKELGPQAFQKEPSGILIPFKKVLSLVQPKAQKIVKDTNIKKHVSLRDGKVTDISKTVEEFGYDEAVKHYEMKSKKSMTLTPARRRKLRDMVKRAADMAVKK